MRRLVVGLLLMILILGIAFFTDEKDGATAAPPPLIDFTDEGIPQPFKRATESQQFVFPRDHGPHFDYQTEWWYFTGNLESENGLHYGYQLTFFRRGLTPGLEDRSSALASNQIYFAHFAITDVSQEVHVERERFSRGAALLAGARSNPLELWLEDWSLQAVGSEGVWALSASDGELELNLELTSRKDPVFHGDRGLSEKSDDLGNASYYVSLTRLETDGQIAVSGDTMNVSGWTWFDHEWSTTALGENAVGWDWFGLNLSDGRDLMLFLIRNQDGSIDSVSGGTLVEQDGRTVRLERDQVLISALDQWTSSTTNAIYPSTWNVSIPEWEIELFIEPWILDQEMNISIVYWEGAVKIKGMSAGEPVSGEGYVELTGYAHSLQGVF